jgi:hypothetical protein
MSFMPRQFAATAVTVVALGAGAAPALASARTAHVAPVKAKTPLIAKIAAETPLIGLKYQLKGGVDQSLEPNALASGRAASSVSRIHADSAQLPAKLEWVLGAYVQARGDNSIFYGQHEQVYGHAKPAKRAIDGGLADFRLSNYYIGHADSLLGVRHPVYSAKPYQPYTNRPPVQSKTPQVAKLPNSSLAATIALGTPLLRESLPDHITNTYLHLNEAASNYYWVLVGRMHVDGAQPPAQLEWVEGVHALYRGDELLSHGILADGPGVTATGKREIESGLATLRGVDAEISHADVLLGVHQSGPTVRLPTKVVYDH